MGALWARRAWADSVVPASAGYISYVTIDPAAPSSPRRPAVRVRVLHRPSVVGLARSCGWLTMYIGLPWAHERAARLAAAAADRLASIDGVSLVTPRNSMATLVAFRIGGSPAADAVRS